MFAGHASVMHCWVRDVVAAWPIYRPGLKFRFFSGAGAAVLRLMCGSSRHVVCTVYPIQQCILNVFLGSKGRLHCASVKAQQQCKADADEVKKKANSRSGEPDSLSLFGVCSLCRGECTTVPLLLRLRFKDTRECCTSLCGRESGAVDSQLLVAFLSLEAVVQQLHYSVGARLRATTAEAALLQLQNL